MKLAKAITAIIALWLAGSTTAAPSAATKYIQMRGRQMSKATERIKNEVPDYKPDRWWNRKHNSKVRFEREMIMAEEGLLNPTPYFPGW